jgi:hypothetical protein
MHPFYSTELGRMRAEEMEARAARYRLAQLAKGRNGAQKQGRPLARVEAFVYRRALRIAALSIVTVVVGIAVF